MLIATGFASLDSFQLPMENRTLLWGLDQANIRWFLYNPWEPPPDLARFDAVLVTVYRAYASNFTYHCQAFEKRAAEAGLPVINTIAGSDGLHSAYLETWRRHEIPCARFQRFRTADDLTLDTYPLILRRDGVHRGNSMILVHNRAEAEAAIRAQHADCAATYPSLRGPLPVDLAIEFVETRKVEGYYCKWRSYVVGDEVIPAHFMRSRSPFVNYKDAALWANTCSMDEVFRMDGEPHPNRVRAAARALGYDIIALDYSQREDGGYIFWEGNRVRATAGDRHVRWLTMREADLTYGAAVARLVRRRVEEADRPAARRPAPRHSRPPAAAFVAAPPPGRAPATGPDRRSVGDIRALVEPLRALVRRKDWAALRPWVEGARLTLKGDVVTAAEVESLLSVRTRDVRDPEIVVEEILAQDADAARAEFHLRLAVVGQRLDGGGGGGMILDVRAGFTNDGEGWTLEALSVDCPPSWALWNARPNDRAPVHYGTAQAGDGAQTAIGRIGA
ncbi:hypothetical protein [Azospirillum argentinense]